MNRAASEPYLARPSRCYSTHNSNTHFVTSSDQAKFVIIQPFHQHPVRAPRLVWVQLIVVVG
jgi:hypothetical protein